MSVDTAQYIARIQREQQRVEKRLAMLRRLWRCAEKEDLGGAFMRDLSALLDKHARPLHDERDHYGAMLQAAERGARQGARQFGHVDQ